MYFRTQGSPIPYDEMYYSSPCSFIYAQDGIHIASSDGNVYLFPHYTQYLFKYIDQAINYEQMGTQDRPIYIPYSSSIVSLLLRLVAKLKTAFRNEAAITPEIITGNEHFRSDIAVSAIYNVISNLTNNDIAQLYHAVITLLPLEDLLRAFATAIAHKLPQTEVLAEIERLTFAAPGKDRKQIAYEAMVNVLSRYGFGDGYIPFEGVREIVDYMNFKTLGI